MAGCCSIPAFIFGYVIALLTWIEYIEEDYASSAGLAIQRASGPIRTRIDSWSQIPFVDVTVLDAKENWRGCPDSHPEELIFEVWPGTMAVCDELESGDLSFRDDITLGVNCAKKGDADRRKRWHRY